MPVNVQLHVWPWSEGIREETVNLTSGESSFPFYGSPVLSISTSAEIYLPRRHERFFPFGPSFITPVGEYRLYEAPHGILASKYRHLIDTIGSLRIKVGKVRESVHLKPYGARRRFSRFDEKQREEETPLARTVIAWSQFFDDLLDSARKAGLEDRLPWVEAVKSIPDVSEPQQPRKALIVHIAEHMRGKLPHIVSAARRILSRERLLLPAERVLETDTACLRWMVRQPGETMIQKAAANRQRFLGIARRESFDTLENRVMKDFICRCSNEGRRYLKTEVGGNLGFQQSERALTVRQYQNLCTDLGRTPFFENVAAPPPVPKPNYVLQNDVRYREIWKHYVRLLRREEEEDSLWDWQSRTWADVCRFLVGAALFDIAMNKDGKLIIEELLTSGVRLAGEQRLGSRILAGSEPGPFLVAARNIDRSRAFVLEIVHPDLAEKHPSTRSLGGTGGHLYLVMTPLTGGRPLVLVVWAVHTAAAENRPHWSEIGRSSGRALQNHRRIIDQARELNSPRLRGFVVASDLEAMAADLHPGASEDLHLVQVPTDQRHWQDAVSGISLVIQDILETVL